MTLFASSLLTTHTWIVSYVSVRIHHRVFQVGLTSFFVQLSFPTTNLINTHLLTTYIPSFHKGASQHLQKLKIFQQSTLASWNFFMNDCLRFAGAFAFPQFSKKVTVQSVSTCKLSSEIIGIFDIKSRHLNWPIWANY